MKIAIIALTDGGKQLAEEISNFYADSFVDTRNLPVFEKLADLWQQKVDAIICIMATGIVVRGVSTLCSDKTVDPCVLVLDEKGQFVISLLSGHLGGGNQLARELAFDLGGQAVITTASDVTGHTALDLWSRKNKLVVDDSKKLTEKAAKLVNTGFLTLFTECELKSHPEDFQLVSDPAGADIIISDALFPENQALILRPCALCVGLGCNRGTTFTDFEDAVSELFADNKLNRKSIATFASIDLKEDEQGMLEFAAFEGIPIKFYAKEQLNSVNDVSSSAVVFAATGAKGVAEPAAVLAAETPFNPGKLIVRKQKWKDVTAAVAMKQTQLVA
jgi:cobalt-precorrin 5A hydrolase